MIPETPHDEPPPPAAARRVVAAAWPYLILAAAFAVLLAASGYIFETLPPWKIVMATGPEGGANFVLGEHYRKILADAGVEMQLRPTSGSVENLRLLRDPDSGVSVALLQGAPRSAPTPKGSRRSDRSATNPYGFLHGARSARTCEPGWAAGVHRPGGKRRQGPGAGTSQKKHHQRADRRVVRLSAANRRGEVAGRRDRRCADCDRMGFSRSPDIAQRQGRRDRQLPPRRGSIPSSPNWSCPAAFSISGTIVRHQTLFCWRPKRSWRFAPI